MKKLLLIFAVILTANFAFSQTPPDTINITLFVSQDFSIQEVASGKIVEGQNYILPAKTLTAPFDVYQYYYDGIAGSKFYIEDGGIDRNVSIRILMEVPPTIPWIVDGKKVWFLGVFEVDGVIGADFWFLNDKAAVFEMPRTPQFNTMVSTLGYTPGTTWQFAYYKTGVGFTNIDISTINEPTKVTAKIRHFSEIGAGDQTLANIGEEVLSTIPKDFELKQNYPNPFNPGTSIEYSLLKGSNVSLKVYNLLGVEVASLVDGYKSAGSYRINFDASDLSSGVYLYKLKANGKTLSKKMLLTK